MSVFPPRSRRNLFIRGHSVLKKNTGVFVYLTFGQPHFRRRYLTRPDAKLEVIELGDMFHYYLYILKT